MTLKRRSSLKPGKRLARRAKLGANAERRARAFEEDFGGEARVKWVRLQECVVCGRWPSECAHVRSRGAGGKAADIVPLCIGCHRQQHDLGRRRFEALHGVDLAALAANTEARWRARVA